MALLFFSIQTKNGCSHCSHEEKNLWSEQLLILFNEDLISFCFFNCGQAIFRQSRKLKSFHLKIPILLCHFKLLLIVFFHCFLLKTCRHAKVCHFFSVNDIASMEFCESVEIFYPCFETIHWESYFKTHKSL